MDVREIAIWHKGAQIFLLNKKIERLFHLRLAQMDDFKPFEKEMDRLQEMRDQFLGIQLEKPKTPEECAHARLQFARAIGLKIYKKP